MYTPRARKMKRKDGSRDAVVAAEIALEGADAVDAEMKQRGIDPSAFHTRQTWLDAIATVRARRLGEAVI